MRGFVRVIVWGALAAALLISIVYFTLPVNRVDMRSRLVMLGDFDGDNRWTAADAAELDRIAADPFALPPGTAWLADADHDGALTPSDLALLRGIYAAEGDAYKARETALAAGRTFPYPREFFRYVPDSEYVQRPVFALPHPAARTSPLKFLDRARLESASAGPYRAALLREIYDEGLRFTLAYARRLPGLHPKEKEYAGLKLARCAALWKAGRERDLLLDLMSLTEDAETLTVKGQPDFVARSLYFRDHLRDLLASPLYADYQAGRQPAEAVARVIERFLAEDMGVETDLLNMPAPRDFLELKNYADRARWQYYKSSSTRADFRELLQFAQYDRRYLRAAARTTRRLADEALENHNLPMILLFREALAIKKGDKKAAVGLIDEAVRIPFTWVKAIPRDKLPASVALENFLLPGNKEDGSDKSRHWNVFGGISLYKSPEESLRLALAREVKDYRDDPSPRAMTEFIRDTMANLNGIYYVVSMDPGLAAI
ncbi:MAG: hypothetical protein RQ748_08390 [Elusimicrobiales bacterium]|nr:hypothetical protein [Elusimicrobiales bacterium]